MNNRVVTKAVRFTGQKQSTLPYWHCGNDGLALPMDVTGSRVSYPS